MPKNGGSGAYWEDASIDPIPSIEVGQKLLDTAFKSDKSDKALYTYFDGKVIKFRASNTNDEWHAYEVGKNVKNEVESDVLNKFKDSGLINNSEYKKLLKK